MRRIPTVLLAQTPKLERMCRCIAAALLLALAGCAAAPQYVTASPCDQGETSYACQVERYNNVNR